MLFLVPASRPHVVPVMTLLASLMLGCEPSAPAKVPIAEAPAAEPSEQIGPTGKELVGKPLYSQHKEELIIRDFFRERRGGVFLDVGCASPIQDSNTAYLEKHLGWSGVAVDALPEFATPWQRKRPKTRFFNFLVSDHSDTVEPFFRSELRGISSGEKPVRGPAQQERSFEQIEVPTITLTKLLDETGVPQVDFMSLDIEGWEPAALAGFEIARFRPQLICVEAKPANRELLMTYFESHGYQRIEAYLEYDTVNWYFTPKEES